MQGQKTRARSVPSPVAEHTADTDFHHYRQAGLSGEDRLLDRLSNRSEAESIIGLRESYSEKEVASFPVTRELQRSLATGAQWKWLQILTDLLYLRDWIEPQSHRG